MIFKFWLLKRTITISSDSFVLMLCNELMMMMMMMMMIFKRLFMKIYLAQRRSNLVARIKMTTIMMMNSNNCTKNNSKVFFKRKLRKTGFLIKKSPSMAIWRKCWRIGKVKLGRIDQQQRFRKEWENLKATSLQKRKKLQICYLGRRSNTIQQTWLPRIKTSWSTIKKMSIQKGCQLKNQF